MIYYACDIPEDLTYDIDRDVWIRFFEGETAVPGMTDVAQTRCGKIAAISFRDVGKKVLQGKVLATIESAKWVGPFPAPFSCEILETNEESFVRDILIANKEPYTRGWLVRVRPDQPASGRQSPGHRRGGNGEIQGQDTGTKGELFKVH